MEESFKVTIDSKNWQRRVQRIISKLDSVGHLSVSEMGRYGRDLIQGEMPQDTGASASSIGYQTVINSKGYHEVQIVQISMPHPEKEWQGEWFNVPFWMFESEKALNFPWKSGDIVAMRNVINVLRTEFRRKIEVNLYGGTIFN